MPRPVLSTYRLQMRADCCTFDDAVNLLDYLDRLGVSHLYLSPILTAAQGSTHGYDVTDPTTVSAALGGPDGLRRLSEAARSRGMGLIVDIVPNHVGVADPEQNRWWWDLLRHGRDSAYADFFDIDWDLDDGRIVLPVLGAPGDVNDLMVDGDRLRLGDLVFPIAPGTGNGTGSAVHERQHYRLTGWRTGICGYRRFFSITSLAALRQEDRAVFDASHVEIKRWFDEGLVDGLRVDHPDGLSDPAGYLRWLRELTGPDAWIVVEKILAADESLDAALPVDGTTGYDALREIGGLFIAPSAEASLTAVSGPRDLQAEHRLKATAVTDTLASELGRLCRVITTATAQSDPHLPAAVAALISRIGVYRTDYPALDAILPMAMHETSSATPELTNALATVAVALSVSTETVTRFNQLCGAATAKAVED
ncbi:alpha-amylase family glycosyl hydrolase, partial [Mycolicibacterium conceptionense]